MFDFGELILMAPAFLLAITVHEFSHGYIAYKLGDPTARDAGRLTFNPLAHLDIFGTLALILIHFGWAKPVPVNPRNFAHPRRDDIWVSLAGPASNFISAFIFGMLFRLIDPFLAVSDLGIIILKMIYYGVWINLVLTIFNLLPIPPLDGFHVLEGLVSYNIYLKLQKFARAGSFILFGLIIITVVTGIPIFDILFGPFVTFFGSLFTGQPFGY